MRSSSAPTSLDRAESTRLRLTFLALLVVSLFVLLFARLWFLQVMAGERYAELAQGNAVRTVTIEAPRGRLLDRTGATVVGNRYANVVSVRLSEIPEERQTMVLADLANLLGLSVTELEERIGDARVSPLTPAPVYIDVDDDIVFYIHENASTRYPGVYAEQLPLRDYPNDALAAHVVGYVGEISEEELALEDYQDYVAGDVIGWAGVERIYEDALRGDKGERLLEVNADNEVVRQLDESLPTAGADLMLTLDLDAQHLAETALAEGIAVAREQQDNDPGRDGGTFEAPAGAVVVLDPDSGEVIALASFPTFDPELFVGGIGRRAWDTLQAQENHFPLINRAVQSSYPPGSVFKIVTAAAAIEYGFATTTSEIECPGRWEWNQSVYRNWNPAHSGSLDLLESLTQSCDTVFYELARRMWFQEQDTGAEVEFLPDEAHAWGFGAVTGIDLPAERAGIIPGRSWKTNYWENNKDTYCRQAAVETLRDPNSYATALFTELCSEDGRTWRGGDAVNMSIGQGDVQTTPLQVANSVAAVANGGTLYRPHVAHEIHHTDGSVEVIQPEVLGTLPVDPATLAYIEQGLLGVTAPGGTGARSFEDFPIPIAGKTGTAEMKPKQPFAWFAGYNPTPVNGQRYVVVAMVEEGGGGSLTAAPIVRNILAGLFDQEQVDGLVGEVTD